MNRKKSIVYLSRYQLEPHPDNPRKDLGDLTELRESIRQNGIMQNLTVIPTDDTLEHFMILIGHRRFAASEGIVNELPCVIVEDLKGMTLEKIKAKVEGKTDVEWNDSYGAIYVCRKLANNEKPKKKKTAWEIESEKRKEKSAKIEAAEDAYCKSVFRFLNESEERNFRAGAGAYTERAWKILLRLQTSLEEEPFNRVFFENSTIGDDYYKELSTKPLLMQMLFFVIQGINQEGFCNYHLEPDKNTFVAIEDLNSILHSLGYNVPSEIDESILDGTSDLYNHPEEDPDDDFEDDFEDDEEC